MSIPRVYFANIYHDRKSKKWIAELPDFPNINTYGNTKEHAVQMAQEALEASLTEDFERNNELPQPSRKGNEQILLSLKVYVAYWIRGGRNHLGISQSEMAKRMGISQQTYQKLERPGHSNPTVETLEKISEALGGSIDFHLAIKEKKRMGA